MSNMFKIKIKDTKMISDASIVNFEHISHILILSLLLILGK